MVDNNNVVCQAAQSPDDHTVIILVTPQDAWVKKMLISATNVFGYELQCGDKAGEPMQGLNANMKFSKVDLGKGCGDVAIQFLKPKFLGVYTDYGTLTIPNSLRGYTIAFFWPNDADGDHWNIFLENLTQTQRAVGGIGGVATEVVKIGQGAVDFRALFA
ncbi:hypothetical protein PRNP1_014131 [Phytophthora ramorum]|nr:hypothetical protein KRP23_10475 [Phytophthora ramorum]